MTDCHGIEEKNFRRILGLFSKNQNITEVILFGSRAKGNFRDGSDIDLALKGKSLTSRDLVPIERDYEDLYFPWKLDLVIYENIENEELKNHIRRVGKVVYSHDRA